MGTQKNHLFEYAKHMFKLINKEKIHVAISCLKNCLAGLMDMLINIGYTLHTYVNCWMVRKTLNFVPSQIL